jgi:hypothetical protein
MTNSMEQSLSPNIHNKVFSSSNYCQIESITILSFLKMYLSQLFCQPIGDRDILLLKIFKQLKFNSKR